MEEVGGAAESVLRQIKSQAAAGLFRVTRHAQEEMVGEEIGIEEVVSAIRRPEILEHYPEHRRGSCCLLAGVTETGRPLHVVSTTAQPLLVLITVYEPQPPKWVTPTKRRTKL